MTQNLLTRRALAVMLPLYIIGIKLGLLRDAWWVDSLLHGLVLGAPFLGIYFWNRERFEKLLYMAPWIMFFAGAGNIVLDALR